MHEFFQQEWIMQISYIVFGNLLLFAIIIHLANKYLLSTYSMPGTVLGSGMEAKNRSGKAVAQIGLPLSTEMDDKQTNKHINNYG